MNPVYFLARYGVVFPAYLTGDASLTANPSPGKEILAFWLDPDIGLLTNWTLAAPMFALLVVLLWRGRIAWRWDVAVFAASSVLLVNWSQSQIICPAISGGTVGVSRYVLWLLFLFFAIQWRLLAWLMTQRPTVLWPLAAVGLALGIASGRAVLSGEARRPPRINLARASDIFLGSGLL